MANNRITAKERGLIKGTLRRVFSRSELRRKAVEATTTDFLDPYRPRVKRWSECPLCEKMVPTYRMEVDHREPLVPLGMRAEDMTFDEFIDRLWCDLSNLQAICPECHAKKTKKESGERAQIKRSKKKGKRRYGR